MCRRRKIGEVKGEKSTILFFEVCVSHTFFYLSALRKWSPFRLYATPARLVIGSFKRGGEGVGGAGPSREMLKPDPMIFLGRLPSIP